MIKEDILIQHLDECINFGLTIKAEGYPESFDPENTRFVFNDKTHTLYIANDKNEALMIDPDTDEIKMIYFCLECGFEGSLDDLYFIASRDCCEKTYCEICKDEKEFLYKED